MQMNRDQARAYIKDHIEDYLQQITTKQGAQYICPFCGSGTGPHRSAAGNVKDTGKGKVYSCFACGITSLDTIGLIARREGIGDGEAFKRAYEIFGIDNSNTRPVSPATGVMRQDGTNIPPHTENAPQVTTEAHRGNYDGNVATSGKYEGYIGRCKAALMTSDEAMDWLHRRGLSDDIISRFNLGFDPSYSKDGLARVIIPSNADNNHYQARRLDDARDGKYLKPTGEKDPIFNLADLYNDTGTVFITEGPMDALSIIQAGAHAAAISGSGYRKLIDQLRNTPTNCTLILTLDNDAAGIANTQRIAEELRALGTAYLIKNISGEHKDPNEAMAAHQGEFERAVSDAWQEADRQREAEAEAERAEYEKNNIKHHIPEFLSGVRASVDTPAIPTGYSELDRALDGGLFEGLYTIGAISSLGKTTFVLQLADQVAQRGQDVLIFSLEMARTELMAKSISRTTFEMCEGYTANAKTTRGITTGARFDGYSHDEKQLINRSVQHYATYADHLYINEGLGDIGTVQIREAVRRHVHFTGNRPVVIIDYLQILLPADPRSTDKQNVDRAVFDLKRISREFKIPIISVASINRNSYTKEISMEAFKESGAIEYSSDVLLGMQFQYNGTEITGDAIDAAKRRDTRKVELKVLKNRNGRTGDKINYDYTPMFNLFQETGISDSHRGTPGRRVN